MTNSTASPSPSVHPAPPGRRRLRLRYVALVLAVLLAGAAGAAYRWRSTAEDAKRPVRVAVGAPGRDGALEFVVSDVKCGTPTVGTGAEAITAQGVYCLVGVQVTNRGTAARHFDGAAQKVVDDSGTQYLSDTAAGLKANDRAWSEPLDPGGVLTGRLLFDVPQGTRPTEIELHETLLSTGVRVGLR